MNYNLNVSLSEWEKVLLEKMLTDLVLAHPDDNLFVVLEKKVTRSLSGVDFSSYRTEHDLLLAAYRSHHKRTGHRDVMIGLNFIECMECGKHAHVDHSGFLEHNSTYSHYAYISPEDF